MSAPEINVKKYKEDSSSFVAGRPGKLSSVDKAANDWLAGSDKVNVNKIELINRIILECKQYLLARHNGPSDSSRKTAVKNLGQEAYSRLKYEIYKEKRLNPNPGTVTKDLDPLYQFERESYVQFKKFNKKGIAYSGTQVHEATGTSMARQDQLIDATFRNNPKAFEDLTLNDCNVLYYASNNLANAYQAKLKYVKYLPRDERVYYMIIIEDGKLYSDFDEPLNLHKHQGAAWAMDAYGCLYCIPDNKWQEFSREFQLNHSTFNAGKPVIAAGMLWVDNGTLKAINNASGHYKPIFANLVNAVVILHAAGVKMKGVYVYAYQEQNETNFVTGGRWCKYDAEEVARAGLLAVPLGSNPNYQGP